MRIGYTYGVNWEALATLNTLTNPDRLSIGQRITVPVTRVGGRVAGLQHPDSNVEVRMAMRKEIVVELDEQIVRAYEDGRLVKTVSVSTGLPQTPTVQGEYSIYHKVDAQTMSGPSYNLPGVPWVMYFYKGYGLHGTYWHDNFGQPMSHGCVNLRTPDAKWFYDWAQIGTPVLVKQ
jgi:lipoprotein-anchoring transpeptidase ErfK/SrfK